MYQYEGKINKNKKRLLSDANFTHKRVGGGVEVAGNKSFCINEEDLMYENYIHCGSVSELICLCYTLFW